MVDKQPQRLRRALGFWALTAYGLGDILGAGIYALVGPVAAMAGSAAWLSFLTTVAIAALTAVSYAELGSRYPKSAGEAWFSRQAFGSPSLALLIGFLVFASGVVSMATVARAFAGYLLALLGVESSPLASSAMAVFLLTLAGINFWGIRQSSATNIVCLIVAAAGLLLVVAAGLAFVLGGGGRLVMPADWTAMGVMQGSALAFFAFIGFEDMVNVAEEVHRPERNMPAAILTAVAVTGTAYVLVAWVATAVVPPAELAASDAPLLEVVRQAAPWVPAWSFTLVALFAVANTALLNFVMASRLLYGMAELELLPSWLHRLHGRTQTPHRAIMVILALVLALALSGTIVHLAGTTNVLLLLVFTVVNLSLLVLKVRGGRRTSGFRTPLPLPFAGAATCLALIVFVPRASLVMAGWIVLLGLLIVAAWVWRRRGAA